MEKTFDEIKKYVLDNLDILMYYDRDKLLREGAYDDGKEEGKKKKSLEIAKKMLEEKMDLKIISKVTGLSKEKIKKLAVN